MDEERAAVEIPKYQCHKQVRAAKITDMKEVQPPKEGEESAGLGATNLFFGEIGGHLIVSGEWMRRFRPTVGGYYVRYEDGYASFSPAKPFEEGYTKI